MCIINGFCLVVPSPTSAVRRLRRHFDLYGLWDKPNSFVYPAFVRGKLDWSLSLSTTQLCVLITSATKRIGADPSRFANHSLHAGGATDLFRCGVYYPTLKKFGRWKTDTALIYYRDDEGVSDAVFNGFLKLSGRPAQYLFQLRRYRRVGCIMF